MGQVSYWQPTLKKEIVMQRKISKEKRAEEKARKWLIREKVGREGNLKKDGIRINPNSGKVEFDISKKKNQRVVMVAQVKCCRKKFDEYNSNTIDSGNQNTRFPRFLVDIVKLSEVDAKARYFFLSCDEEMFKKFTEWLQKITYTKKFRRDSKVKLKVGTVVIVRLPYIVQC